MRYFITIVDKKTQQENAKLDVISWSIGAAINHAQHHLITRDEEIVKVEKVKELNVQTHYDNNPDVIAQLPGIGKLFTK